MKKAKKIIFTSLFIILGTVALLAAIGMTAQAAGLVDDTVDTGHLYSQYSLSRYELDFYVDNSWAWLPWNWADGIGKSVMYGLNAVSNVLWLLSTYLSSATGYVLQEAYNLDFIGTMSTAVGNNIQALAGVTPQGISSTGFYSGMLGIIVLIVGIYAAYMGLYKRATSKVVSAIVSMVVLFVISGAFIAYAPDYISAINDFSSDMSTEALKIGVKIVSPNTETDEQDSTTLIRENLFAIQIKQPWLLLQFGDSNIENIGEERATQLLSTTGEERENIVKSEIEDNDNKNLSVTKVGNRLGTVIFLLVFNLFISVFVLILCGIMIFSQFQFIIYATILPISFLLGMIPSFSGTWQKAVLKVFNALLVRTGVTLILTIAFSLSSMVYSLSVDHPFFFVMLLQIIVFGGIYLKLNELLGMFALQNDSHGMTHSVGHRAKHLMHRSQHNLMNAMHGLGRKSGKNKGTTHNAGNSTESPQTENYSASRPPKSSGQSRPTASKPTVSERLGRAVGNVMDMPHKLKDKAVQAKDTVASVPTNARYAAHQTKTKAVEGVKNFTGTVGKTQAENQTNRMEKRENQRMTVAQRRAELEQRKKKPVEPVASAEEKYNQGSTTANNNVDKRTPAQTPSVNTKSNKPLPTNHNNNSDTSKPVQNSSVPAISQDKQVKNPVSPNLDKRPPATSRNQNISSNSTVIPESANIAKSPVIKNKPIVDKRKTATAKQRPSKNNVEPMASMQEIKNRSIQSPTTLPPRARGPRP